MDPLSVLIDFVCDAHVDRDPVGPFVTRHEGGWAYCAGYGNAGHAWRRVVPVSRELIDREGTRVRLVCADPHHLEHGQSVPDREGFLIVADGKWAYCSATLHEPHVWREVAPIEFREIQHDALARAA